MVRNDDLSGKMTSPRFDPAIADDAILLANLHFDRTHPRDDDNYFSLPMPDWMDRVSPDYDPYEAEPGKSVAVWMWLRRGMIIA